MWIILIIVLFFGLTNPTNHNDLSSDFAAISEQMFSGLISQIPTLNLLFKVMEICRDITPFAAARKQCFPVFLI